MNFCLVVSYFFIPVFRKQISAFQFLFAILGIAHVNGMRNQVTQEIRDEFVDMHNSYRSLLAEGLIDTETGVAGPAKKMKKMVSLRHGTRTERQNCWESSSSSEENLYVVGNEGHEPDPVLDAGNKWWNEGFHMNQERDKSLYRTGFKMSSFANMAWDTRNKVGCAIVDCSGKTHVVCHYEEKDGENIYEIGQQCTGCSDYGSNVKCENDLCIA
ncbi:SCP-like protein [Ancylostoma caninum]|uniref:SCP-like protein n=1 Tax=Ancylostoma caninum TaxID=29170 RepID=A0A368H5Q3_ANCCA|nr:SCP-like protein [Ancylostoma caninum]